MLEVGEDAGPRALRALKPEAKPARLQRSARRTTGPQVASDYQNSSARIEGWIATRASISPLAISVLTDMQEICWFSLKSI